MEFKEHLKKYLTDDLIEKLMFEMNQKPKKSIIINTNKIDDSFILEKFPNLIPHPFVKHCYLFDENEYQLGKHIYFEQGLYYIFEPCSALVNYFLNSNKNDIVLDLCASPGGKTSHLAIIKQDQGIIVSNEISRERALILSSNVERMGFGNVIVTNNSIDDFSKFENTFDKIILDAPCSGSGMFRKETKMKDDWTYEKVLSLSLVQKELIIKAYNLLKPGGKLIYSTCSFSYEEDEEVIDHLLSQTDAKVIPIENNNLFYQSESRLGIHLFPFLFPGEGHYMCLIEKPDQPYVIKQNKKVEEKEQNKIKDLCQVDGYIYHFDNIYYRLPIPFDFKNLKVIRGGLKLGTKEKYGFELDHALSHYLKKFSLQLELNEVEITSYLQGNALKKDIEDGMVLITYQNIPVGFSKATKGRINNKYPKGLRINQVKL